MDKIILTISGGAEADDFEIFRSSDDLFLAAGEGKHTGSGETNIVFDMKNTGESQRQITEGTTRDYLIRADVSSAPDRALVLRIADLGKVNNGMEEGGAVWWSEVGGAGSSSKVIDQTSSEIGPIILEFN